jgi:hypothetical protein
MLVAHHKPDRGNVQSKPFGLELDELPPPMML